MKVLLDENLPLDFRYFLTGHDVFTVSFMGWKGNRPFAPDARKQHPVPRFIPRHVLDPIMAACRMPASLAERHIQDMGYYYEAVRRVNIRTPRIVILTSDCDTSVASSAHTRTSQRASQPQPTLA